MIQKVEDGSLGKLTVTAKYNHGTKFVDEFNTVIFAIGRDACTAKMGLEGVGVALNPKNGKLLHNKLERSGVDNIYASATCWSPRAVSTCAPRYGRTTENSCYWLLNFPYVGVHPAVAQLLRPGGGGGHRADRQGECGGVSPEHLSKISK